MQFNNLKGFAVMGIFLSLAIPLRAEEISNSCTETQTNGNSQCGKEIVQANTKEEIMITTEKLEPNQNSVQPISEEVLGSDQIDKDLK